MTTIVEDVRQICRAIGLSGSMASVVPLVLLGVALNIAALSTTAHLRGERHRGHEQRKTALRSAARTELKVMRAVLVSTLRKIGDGDRGWCMARQWVADRQAEITG
jgi:hypothetical protein